VQHSPGDACNFLGIVREQHDLVAMFGQEYHHHQARNDNARRKAT
jgi:hypothetical protein